MKEYVLQVIRWWMAIGGQCLEEGKVPGSTIGENSHE
jgi:hypothetical protein